MAESKSKTFTYHKVRFQLDPKGKTLQQLLNEAFDGTSVQERHHASPDNSKEYSFIATKSDFKGFFCANLWKYEDGKIAQVIKANFDKESIEYRALPLETDDDGTPQYYLEGKLNFACFKNHMIVCGDQNLRAVHLERYLHNLFSARLEHLPAQFQFFLERSIPLQTARAISGVKTLVLSSDIATAEDRIDLHPKKSGKTFARYAALSDIVTACNTLFRSDVNLSELPLAGLSEHNTIKVALSLDWKRENRKDTESVQLDQLANVFRNVESGDLDVSIKTTNGGRYSSKDLQLSVARSVEHRDGMPVFDDVSDKMIKWYTELNDASQI